MIYDHSQCIRTQVYVDGNFKNARIYTTADYLTANHIINRSLQPYSGVLVIHHVPTDPQGRDFYHEFKSAIPFMEAYVGYTTFETDSIPSYWVSSCNQMDEIWVPSKFNLETFGNAGVAKDKLYVIPHGFDPKRYAPDTTRPLNFGSKSKFTFLSVFEWTYRKGWDVLIRAFIEEFAPHENVRLLIRTYMGGGVIGPQTESVSTQFKNYIRDLGFNHNNIPTIEFIDTTIPDQLMPNLYKTADVFVLPTRGEGWGIPFTESMLMEVPVIGTKWGGQLEFMNEDNAYLIEVDKIVPVSESQVKDSPFYKGHKWAEPSVEHLRKLMRRVFKDPEEAKEKAKKARKWILDNYTIYHTAIKIAKRVEALRNSKVRPTAKCKSRKNVNLKVLFQSRS
ncbi:MAG: glycosyltransferase, partial [Nitrososphaeria archaeon]